MTLLWVFALCSPRGPLVPFVVVYSAGAALSGVMPSVALGSTR